MLKKILLLIVTIITLGQNLLGDDYYNYGEWRLVDGTATGIAGFIDKEGKINKKNQEYILFTIGNGWYSYTNTAYLYRVDTQGDPQKHLNNPESTGEIADRNFTYISSHTVVGESHKNAFSIDNSGIYYGGSAGIKRWDFNWNNESTIVDSQFSTQSFTRNPRTGDYWLGGTYRRIYKWNGNSLEYQFTCPNLGGDHHDGMMIANDILFISDMTSDKIAIYKLDKEGNVINPDTPNHIYSYSASPPVEGMGFGPNNHIWVAGGSVIYEIGGGKLQEQLASCTQSLALNGKWQMLSSACDINATGFRDSVIMKKVDEKLVVVSDNNETRAYYAGLGYATNSTLELKRGEGFWIRSENNETYHRLNGEEQTTTIELKKDTTRFIGFAEYESLNLDEMFADTPVKEIRYWDDNSTQWQKWQPNHVDTNLSTIPHGHGFYVCVAEDFNLSLPNLAPIIQVEGDLNITVDNTLLLDASKSFDRDGKVISYEWKEGNVTLSRDMKLSKDDFTLGWHKVVLSVTDDDAMTSSKQMTVWISKLNILPTVDLGEDRNITQGDALTVSPSITDSDGYILSHEWRLDGSVVATTPYISLEDLSVGEHNLTLSVLDDDLGRARDSIKIIVNPLPDTTPPTITILGDNPTIVNIGTTYHDAGAIAIDAEDGNLSVESQSSVDSSKVGEYTVVYSAVDSASNSAEVIRKVYVQDPSSNTPPVVNLGEDRRIIEGEIVRLYADAHDSDGYIKSYAWQAFGSLVVDGQEASISDLTAGRYNITITVTDDKGAKASDSILLNVLSKDEIDTTPPVISILGDNPHIMYEGDSYTDAGATAFDNKEGNLSVGFDYNITTNKAGVYVVRYYAQDKSGNKSTAYRSVLIKQKLSTTLDTTPPVITILGDNPTVLVKDSNYTDAGATAFDDVDGNLNVGVEYNITTSTVGVYHVSYTAIDTSGNRITKQRSVVVQENNSSGDTVDTTPPTITILGDNPHIMLVGENYTDAGATAWDDKDGNLSVGVEYNISTNKVGLYHVAYRAVDSAGNSVVAQRSVVVQAEDITGNTAPVMTLLGANPTILFLGEQYIDKGVIVLDAEEGELGYTIEHNINIHRLGSYSVIYKAQDSAKNKVSLTRQIYVKDASGNKAPIANAGRDKAVAMGEDLVLDASLSDDSDGDIVSYLWKEKGQVVSDKKVFRDNTFAFGAHVFTLTVVDNDGLSDSDTLTIHVIDPSDTIPPQPPYLLL